MAKGLLALSRIYVQPAYRSKGVGWQLIEPLVMVARVKRWKRFELWRFIRPMALK